MHTYIHTQFYTYFIVENIELHQFVPLPYTIIVSLPEACPPFLFLFIVSLPEACKRLPTSWIPSPPPGGSGARRPPTR